MTNVPSSPATSPPEVPGFLVRANRLKKDVEPYLPGITRAAAAALAGTKPEAIAKLSSNENPLGASPNAMEAVRRLLGALHEYPSPRADDLRAAIGKYLDVDAEQVVVGAGSSTLMHSIVEAFTAPGGEIISLDPGFTVYGEIGVVHGRVPVQVKLCPRDFRLDLERLAAAITPRTQLIFLTRPNNPTSTLIPLADFEKAAQMASKVGALIVSDEAYIEFADDPRAASAIQLIQGLQPRHANVMVSRTFSKAFGLANLRLGYAVGVRETAAALALANAKWPTGAVAQAAGVAALADAAHLKKTTETVAAGRRLLVEAFNALGLPVAPHPQGNYIMVDVSPSKRDAKTFTQEIFERGHVIIRGDFSPQHVRVSIGTAEENRRLIDAVRAVLENRR